MLRLITFLLNTCTRWLKVLPFGTPRCPTSNKRVVQSRWKFCWPLQVMRTDGEWVGTVVRYKNAPIQRAPYTLKLNCAVQLWKKKLQEKLNWMFSGAAQFSHQVCLFFFVSSVCLLVRVTVVDKNRLSFAVGFPEWTAQFSVWKTTGKDSSEACAIACQNCAVYSVFHQVWRHKVKSPSLTDSV
jgi:hypothetical protein